VADARVSTLRELFRNLKAWRLLYEADGLDLLVDPIGGVEWSLHDVEYLASNGVDLLSERQQQAIRWFLIEGGTEADVATRMGIDPSNPIGMYATDGIKRLLSLIDAGRLPRFRFDEAKAA
jgi:hypothetical protein